MLIYAKNGHRPQLLEHLAEVFPRHIQIHYGRYQREELFEAARRSRACAYLADDDHGPLALQEILLAGSPTVGVRTGASFVRTGQSGVVVDRLPPGQQCVKTDDDLRTLAVFMEAIEEAQALDRHSVRDRAAEQFHTGLEELLKEESPTPDSKSLAAFVQDLLDMQPEPEGAPPDARPCWYCPAVSLAPPRPFLPWTELRRFFPSIQTVMLSSDSLSKV